MQQCIVTKHLTEFVPRDRWIASLSNGETIFEDNIPGELSSWDRLREYVKQNKLAITNLRLQIAGTEITLPPKQEGYVQKKRIQSTGSYTTKSCCIGYAQAGRALIHYVSNDMSSNTAYEADPGPPFTIYRHDIECNKKCCVNTNAS